MSYDPDEMMLELFRAEVESHSDSLTNSLLKLEQDPESTAVLDGMMRAAHSIKGAARIVRVDPAVEVAHVMEDCFVAAQRGELVLEPSGIDVLLRGVDLLVQISEASKKPNVDWTAFDSSIRTIVSQLQCVLNKQPVPTTTPVSLADNTIAIKSKHDSAESISAISETTVSETTVASTIKPSSVESSAQVHRFVLPLFLGEANAEQLRVQLLALLSANEMVCLDFGSMQDLDAIGLAWLHSAAKHAAKHGKQITAMNVNGALQPILELVGLHDSRGA